MASNTSLATAAARGAESSEIPRVEIVRYERSPYPEGVYCKCGRFTDVQDPGIVICWYPECRRKMKAHRRKKTS